MRTFAPAFENNASHEPKRKSSLKDLHKQRSSTRSELHYLFSVVWVEKKRTVNLYWIESLLYASLILESHPKVQNKPPPLREVLLHALGEINILQWRV